MKIDRGPDYPPVHCFAGDVPADIVEESEQDRQERMAYEADPSAYWNRPDRLEHDCSLADLDDLHPYQPRGDHRIKRWYSEDAHQTFFVGMSDEEAARIEARFVRLL